MVPGNGGQCDHCLRNSLVTSNSDRFLVAPSTCSLKREGCDGSAYIRVPGIGVVCKPCHRTGAACHNAAIGCKGRIPFTRAGESTLCRLCVRHGLPCQGPDGMGCKHPVRRNSASMPRRQQSGNDNMCINCNPAKCSFEGCSSRVDTHSWTQRLCRRHATLKKRDGLQLKTQLHSFASRTFRRSSTPLGNKTCHIRWCTAEARHVELSHGSPVNLCARHRRWFRPQSLASGHGARTGYAAGRYSLDDYVHGQVRAFRLSDTGRFSASCSHCNALYFAAEANGPRKIFTSCCRNGALRSLPCLPPAPTLLAQLLTGFTADDHALPCHPFTSAGLLTSERLVGKEKSLSAHFCQHIRRYNAAIGFASFTDTMVSASDTSATQGPPVYVLHGRAYHVAGTLYPPCSERPSYAQLYVLDPEVASEHRLSTFEGLQPKILRRLHDMLVEPVLVKDPWTGVCFCHTSNNACKHVCVLARTRVCEFARVCVYVYVVCVCTCVCVCLCVCVCVCTCVLRPCPWRFAGMTICILQSLRVDVRVLRCCVCLSVCVCVCVCVWMCFCTCI